MSKDKLETIAAEQTDRIKRINIHHQGCQDGFKTQLGHAFLAGVELRPLKDAAGHGHFEELQKRYLPELKPRSARRYMSFVDGLIAASKQLADLTPKLLLTNGEPLPDKHTAAILDTVYDFADGKTLTELYRDLGLVRGPKKPGGSSAAGAAPKRKLTAEERAAEACQIALGLIADLRAHHTKWTRLDDATRDAFRDQLIITGKALGAAKPPKSSTRNKSK
jgi:hypothetical protein